MYHLLVSYSGWQQGRDTILRSRVFEATDQLLIEKFEPNGQLDSALISKIPALFVSEIDGPGDQQAHVGTVFKAEISGKDLVLEYSWDPEVAPIPNAVLQRLASELKIGAYELIHTHWAIKNVDLFKTLLRNNSSSKRLPKVFEVTNPEVIETDFVSAMMPFSSDFDEVYSVIKQAAQDANMRCSRADDIWIHNTIIQDVVSLIDRSRIIVSDCTGRNPNVFYETGIAHTLGRDVVLITQSDADIPFDLQHIRYFRYLNNSEGLGKLRSALAERLRTLVSGSIRG